MKVDIANWIRPTTVIELPDFQKAIGADVTIITETFQKTGSFKYRAALTLVANVPNKQIIAASSGNFGQAIACACQQLGKSCTIVMPFNSAKVKIAAVQGYGGEVDLIDPNQISRADRVAELAATYPDAYIASAYDDQWVIMGNATLAHELAALPNKFDVVICPVGGGGLISGMISGLCEVGSPIEVIGAEPALANDASQSINAGRIVENLTEPQTIADGARTVSLGELNWKVIQFGLKEIVEAPEETIRAAVRLLFGRANLKVEPTGALSVAAVMVDPKRFAGLKVACVVSGGNVDPAVFAELIR